MREYDTSDTMDYKEMQAIFNGRVGILQNCFLLDNKVCLSNPDLLTVSVVPTG